MLSIGSVGSFGSAGSIGSAGSLLSIGSAGSVASVLSFASAGAVLASRARPPGGRIALAAATGTVVLILAARRAAGTEDE